MDWSAINWVGVGVLAAIVFLSALIGSFIGRRNTLFTALLTAIIFAGIYIGWAGYLGQQVARTEVPETGLQDRSTKGGPMEEGTTSGSETGSEMQ